MEQVTIWQVLVALLIPVQAAGFWLLWHRISDTAKHNEEKRAELWKAFDDERKGNHAFQLEVLKDFARVSVIADLKKDLDTRLGRMEAKIDQLRPHAVAGE